MLWSVLLWHNQYEAYKEILSQEALTLYTSHIIIFGGYVYLLQADRSRFKVRVVRKCSFSFSPKERIILIFNQWESFTYISQNKKQISSYDRGWSSHIDAPFHQMWQSCVSKHNGLKRICYWFIIKTTEAAPSSGRFSRWVWENDTDGQAADREGGQGSHGRLCNHGVNHGASAVCRRCAGLHWLYF